MLYVMADIHGNMRRFQSILNQIDLKNEDTLFVLGDVIDRHAQGIQILQMIIKTPNIKMILGNHEYMMLNALAPRSKALPWIRGEEDEANGLWLINHCASTQIAFLRLPHEERQEIIDFLIQLPLVLDVKVNGKAYKLVHASPPEWYSERYWHDYRDQTMFAVWNRLDGFSEIPKNYTLVFGHTPTNYYQKGKTLSIWHGTNLIGIDCGSGFGKRPTIANPFQGRLACLRLDDYQEYYSEEES